MTVKAHIKKFLTQSLQSEIVKPERDSTLMAIIKPHLILESAVDETDPEPEGYEEIKIELPDLRQVYNSKTGRSYYCDTMFRDHIDNKGLEKVRNFFNRTFKAAYRTFMDGYIESQNDAYTDEGNEESRLRVKRGAVSFLMSYHIDPDERLITALTRDWYRHRERTEKNRFSPVLY